MMQIASLTLHFRRLRSERQIYGPRVPIRGPDISKPVWKGIWRGSYEAIELMALGGLMRPSDRVLKLGAGMGLVSGVMARRHRAARFVSYEANPGLAPVIADLHLRNGITNVNLRSAVVAPVDQRATRPFHLHQNFTEGSLVAQSADWGETEVAVHDSAAVIAEVRPDLLLCDIEGSEEELIPSLPMAGLRAAVIELNPLIVSLSGKARIFSAFHDAGLLPVVELSSAAVVAFEQLPAA